MPAPPNPRRQPDHRSVAFEIEVLESLQPDAERRGIHVGELVRRIVATVAKEGMVDAVLDDR